MNRASVSCGMVSFVPYVIEASEEKEKKNGSELFEEIITPNIQNLAKKKSFCRSKNLLRPKGVYLSK